MYIDKSIFVETYLHFSFNLGNKEPIECVDEFCHRSLFMSSSELDTFISSWPQITL